METLDIEIETQKAMKVGYETAMEEAHEAMIKLLNLDYNARKSIFGCDYDSIVRKYDIRTIIGKLYEFKEKNKIYVGDEYSFGYNTKVVVTSANEFEDNVYFLEGNGNSGSMNVNEFKRKFKKTGKNYPKLISILKGLES